MNDDFDAYEPDSESEFRTRMMKKVKQTPAAGFLGKGKKHRPVGQVATSPSSARYDGNPDLFDNDINLDPSYSFLGTNIFHSDD